MTDKRNLTRIEIEHDLILGKHKDKHSFSELEIKKMSWFQIQNLRGKCSEDETKKYRKDWQKNNKEKRIIYIRNHATNHPEYATNHKIHGKKMRDERKKLVISHYSSNTMKCACCGESHYEFLTIDHIIGGDGKKHREKVGRSDTFYLWLIKNNFPEGYQVLCWNCNKSKGIHEFCSHKGLINNNLTSEKQIRQRNLRVKVKKEVIAYYSNNENKCICCGENNIDFLCIDHINGGGNKHRKKEKSYGYSWFINNNFPSGYRVLCHNCNSSLGFYHYCPHHPEGVNIPTNFGGYPSSKEIENMFL